MHLKIQFQHILLFVFLLCRIAVTAQEEEKRGVLVSNAEKGKSHLIIEGYKVKIFTKDSNVYVGVLGIHDANTIVVGKDKIKVSDIEEFRGNNRRRTVGGKVTMLTGAGLLGAAVLTFIVTGEIEEITPLVKIMIIAGSVGVVSTAVGAAMYADKRDFKVSRGWSFRVSGGKTLKSAN